MKQALSNSERMANILDKETEVTLKYFCTILREKS